MPANDLIDQYLQAFAAHVRGRRDCADLVDEVDDHLRTAVERLQALGVDSTTAQRRALARFGEPRLVAALVTSIPSKGSTMSLFLSRRLAASSSIAAALWLGAAVTGFFGWSDSVGGWTRERYLVSAVVLMLACLVTTAALIGVNVRSSGSFDRVAAGVAVLGLAATACAVLAWLVGLWLPLLTAAIVWTVARARAARASSRPFAVVVLALLPLLAIGAVVVSAVALFDSQAPYRQLSTEFMSWSAFAGLAVLIMAALIDIAMRAVRRPSPAGTAVA